MIALLQTNSNQHTLTDQYWPKGASKVITTLGQSGKSRTRMLTMWPMMLVTLFGMLYMMLKALHVMVMTLIMMSKDISHVGNAFQDAYNVHQE